MSETIYNDKIVCFIDILRFGDMIEHEYLNDPEKIYAILSEIKTSILDWGKAPIASKIELQITQFSDCIVFSFIPTRHYFMTFHFFKELSIKMIMKHRVIFRGGITYGQIFHDSEMIFGPAMNRAYRLESKEAIYPRIIIDKSALGLKDDNGKTISDYPGQFVFQLTATGYSYIDYIIDVSSYVNQQDYYENLRNIISKGLAFPDKKKPRPSEDSNIIAKYEWMRDEYNKAKENYSQLITI